MLPPVRRRPEGEFFTFWTIRKRIWKMQMVERKIPRRNLSGIGAGIDAENDGAAAGHGGGFAGGNTGAADGAGLAIAGACGFVTRPSVEPSARHRRW